MSCPIEHYLVSATPFRGYRILEKQDLCSFEHSGIRYENVTISICIWLYSKMYITWSITEILYFKLSLCICLKRLPVSKITLLPDAPVCREDETSTSCMYRKSRRRCWKEALILRVLPKIKNKSVINSNVFYKISHLLL